MFFQGEQWIVEFFEGKGSRITNFATKFRLTSPFNKLSRLFQTNERNFRSSKQKSHQKSTRPSHCSSACLAKLKFYKKVKFGNILLSVD